jgi:hypothetical protein
MEAIESKGSHRRQGKPKKSRKAIKSKETIGSKGSHKQPSKFISL